MGNLVIATSTWGDAATLSASSAAAGRGVENLQRMQPRTRWQSIGTGPHYLRCVAATVKPFNLIAPLFHNGSAAATWRVRSGPTIFEIGLDTNISYDSTNGFGSCVEFNGVDAKVTVTGGSALNVGTFTIEAQIRPQILRRQGIIARSGGSSITANLSMRSDGCIRFFGMPGVIADLVSTNPVPVREWTHIAATYSTSTLEAHLYINGELVASATSLTATFDGAGLEIGSVESDRFWGQIDDVRFWNTARTPSEISANYQAEIATSSPLVGYWKFNDASGTTAGDTSASSLDGTLEDGAAFVYPMKLRVPWGSIDDVTGEMIDATDTWGTHHGLLWIPSGVTDAAIRCDFIDPDNIDGHLSIGRLYIGAAWQLTQNMQYGSDLFGYSDSSPLEDLPSGPTVPLFVEPKPQRSFSISATNEREMLENAHELARLRGGSRDCLVVFNPEDEEFLQQQMVYGLLQQQHKVINSAWSLYEANYTISGLL